MPCKHIMCICTAFHLTWGYPMSVLGYKLATTFGLSILAFAGYVLLLFFVYKLGKSRFMHSLLAERILDNEELLESLKSAPVVLAVLPFALSILILAILIAGGVGIDDLALVDMFTCFSLLASMPIIGSFIRGLVDQMKPLWYDRIRSEQFSREYDECIGERSSHWPEQYR